MGLRFKRYMLSRQVNITSSCSIQEFRGRDVFRIDPHVILSSCQFFAFLPHVRLNSWPNAVSEFGARYLVDYHIDRHAASMMIALGDDHGCDT